MPYIKKRGVKKYGKRPVKKFTKKTYKKSNSRLISLIKKVSLKNVETKSVHKVEENINIYHNLGSIHTNLLKTSQGITDTDTGSSAYSNRIGDEVIARGISIKLWIANKKDRPNVMYRMVVFRYQSASIPTLSSCFVGANGNRMMDQIDKEYISVIYQKIFNLQTNFNGIYGASTTDAGAKEAHTYRKIWIPLKNKKLVYNNGGTIPKFTDIGFFIVPYDSYGTLTTDNISSYAFEYQFYFKDA